MRGNGAKTSERMLRLLLTCAESPEDRLKVNRRLLKATPDLAHDDARRIDNCQKYRPCNHELCTHCGMPGKRKKLMKTRSRIYEEPPTVDDLLPEPKKRNFRARAGQILENNFGHFDPDTVFPITIHLDMVPWGEDVEAAFINAKKCLKNVLNRKCFKGCVFKGFIEDKQFYAGNVRNKGFLKSWHWAKNMSDDDIVTNLHIHGAIHLPGASKEEIRQRFSDCGYRGSNQVFLDNIRPKERVNGRLKGGLQGWGEYSGKRFTGSLPASKDLDVAREALRLRKKLNRKTVQVGVGTDGYSSQLPTWKCEAPQSLEEFHQEMEMDQQAINLALKYMSINNYPSDKVLEQRNFFGKNRTNGQQRPLLGFTPQCWQCQRDTEPI